MSTVANRPTEPSAAPILDVAPAQFEEASAQPAEASAQSEEASAHTGQADDRVLAPSAKPSGALTTVAGEYVKLIELFAAATPMSMSHWNSRTGDVFALPAGKRRQQAAQDFERLLWRDEAWVEVPFQESDAAFALATEFVASLQPGRGRVALQVALQGPKPFRAFRAAIAHFAGLARRWYAQQAAEAELRLIQFCLAQSWALADPRFAGAVERWLDANDEQVEVAPQPFAERVRVAVAALSLARKAAGPTCESAAAEGS